MRLLAALALFIIHLTAIPAFAQQPPGGVAETPRLEPADEKARIKLPPGFELQLVASDPDIRKPMNICFDGRGRIWLTDTVEYPFPAPPGRPGRDRILILDDFGPDGRARKITVFAEGLNIPIGILPYKDGCIAWSIPNLWFFRDADGDGRADAKEVLYGPFDYVDTHGNVNSLTIGYDGWLYACHGFRNDSHVKGRDGQVLHLNSGNVFRMKLDGARLEAFTRGQVNPFGLAWDPLGNLYSACCHSRPLTQLLRGAIYESFAKPHDGLGFAPHMNDFGQEHSTGLCGLVYYDADHFPKEYHGRLFMSDVVLNRVNSYTVKHTGSSPRAYNEKFITSDDPWFRAVDLRLGPDGAIYLADFYNCIIGHYEVPLTHPKRDRTSGRVWRIVWKGADGKAAPPQRPYGDLAKEPVEQLTRLLGHANIVVRMQAADALVARGRDVARTVKAPLVSLAPTPQRIHALWVLERLGALDDEDLDLALRGVNDEIHIHAARLLAERKEITQRQRTWLRERLTDDSPMLRRAAADALGRHPSADTFMPLLDMLHRVDRRDAHLERVVLMAVRDHVKAGLLAGVKPEQVAGRERTLARAILGAPGPDAAAYLLRILPDGLMEADLEFIARHGSDDTLAGLVARVRLPESDAGAQLARFRAVWKGLQARGTGLTGSAREWAEDLLEKALASKDLAVRERGAELAGEVKLASKQERLVALARDAAQAEGPRAAACAALVAIDPARHLALLGQLVQDAATPPGLRTRVARTLGTLNQPQARAELVKALAVVPAGLADTIALGLAATPAGGEELLKAVAQGKASPRLLQARPITLQLLQHRLPNLNRRLESLTAGLPPADEKMNALIRTRGESFAKAKGDAALGIKVYAKHCAACHQIGGQGAKVGPQLDGIGARSAERLLEDILDPNRNVDPAFRASRLSLKDGRDLQGLVLREEGEVVVLADDKGKETRVEKKQIEERTVSSLSPMPANWADLIPADEMNHLLAYLLSQRAK